jgi:DNA gyrase subunit A
MGLTKQTGNLVAVQVVRPDDEVLVTTARGLVVRLAVDKVRKLGRAARGRLLVPVKNGDVITAVTVVVRPTEGE